MNECLLAALHQGARATVAAIQGGAAFQHRLRSVGLKEGKALRVVAKHPLRGPMVIDVEHRQISIGGGMAHKVVVHKLP